MKKKEQFISRRVMKKDVLMPFGETAQKFSGMVITTETGAFIWNHIEDVNSPEEMARLLTEEYEVSFEVALSDATGVIDSLIKAGWIE